MENRDPVGQKRAEVMALLAGQAILFARQGSVQQSWRVSRGAKLGPYFYLRFRQRGRQRQLYLGVDRPLAEEVRAVLRAMQARRQEQYALKRLRRRARAALRTSKRTLNQELRQRGLFLKGLEIRGRRQAATTVVPLV